MPYHLVATGGVDDDPVEVELITNGFLVGILYAMEKLWDGGLLVVQVGGCEGQGLVLVEDAVEIFVEAVLAGDGLLQGHGSVAVLEVVEVDVLAVEDLAELGQQRVVLVAFELSLHGKSAQHLERLQPTV